MPDIVVCIHTLAPLIDLFDTLSPEIIPGVQLKHILDEPLLEGIRQRGGLSSADSARMWDHVKMSESIGARAVLATCSTLSPVLDNLRPLTALSLVKIDEAMHTAAVQAGSRLGVLATNAATLKYTQMMLERQAYLSSKVVSCEVRLVEGAFIALQAGKFEEHDQLIRQAVLEFYTGVDVVVLAQASMARVLAILPESERRVPVLSSPRLALEQVRKVLYELGWG